MVTAKDTKILYVSYFDTQFGCMVAIADQVALYVLQFVDRQGLDREIEVLKKKTKSAIVPGRSPIIDGIEQELQQYFQGDLKVFTTPLQFLGSPFQQQVWHELQKVSYGQTQSYAQLATAISKPSAFRAVAQANKANPIAIVIPCHRIINSNGAVGGYAGGIDRKVWLINHENR